MPDLVNVTYAQTGKSLAVNRLGMGEMQERVLFEVWSKSVMKPSYKEIGTR